MHEIISMFYTDRRQSTNLHYRLSVKILFRYSGQNKRFANSACLYFHLVKALRNRCMRLDPASRRNTALFFFSLQTRCFKLKVLSITTMNVLRYSVARNSKQIFTYTRQYKFQLCRLSVKTFFAISRNWVAQNIHCLYFHLVKVLSVWNTLFGEKRKEWFFTSACRIQTLAPISKSFHGVKIWFIKKDMIY